VIFDTSDPWPFEPHLSDIMLQAGAKFVERWKLVEKVGLTRLSCIPCHENHRMAWVGRDLKDHQAPTSLFNTRPSFSGPHPIWPWTTPGVGHPQPLWAACSSIWVKTFILTSSLNLSSFSFKPFPLALSLSNYVKSSPSVPLLLVSLLQVLEGCNEVSLEPSLLQAKHAQLPQPFFIGEVL